MPALLDAVGRQGWDGLAGVVGLKRTVLGEEGEVVPGLGAAPGRPFFGSGDSGVTPMWLDYHNYDCENGSNRV